MILRDNITDRIIVLPSQWLQLRKRLLPIAMLMVNVLSKVRLAKQSVLLVETGTQAKLVHVFF